MTGAQIDHRPQDDQTRARIRQALDETLFVEAGAGTGKTSALVDRVVALVLGNRRIERIVAITFTEKAAAELRDRVRAGLERALIDEPSHGDAVQEALASLDRAQISTIHSFGQTLLLSLAAEAGIDPSFSVQDEVLAERRLQERWRTYLEAIGHEPEAVAAINRVLALGLTPRDLEKLARELALRPGLASRLAQRPLAAEQPLWPDLNEARARLVALPLGAVPADDQLRQKMEAVSALLQGLLGARQEREAVLASGAALLDQSFSSAGNAATWGGPLRIQHVRETATTVCQELKETLARCRSEALAGVMPLIVRFVQEDAGDRGREGSLTFDDLILRPRDLLRENRDAVRALRERYDALLIDEFQDTDPLQVDIALAFASDPDTGRLAPGRLFLVGDPKQSIYRFRRADMAVYARTRDLIEAQGGEFPALSHNRRSRSLLLDWVNAVFARLIGEGESPTVQPPYKPIYTHRDGRLKGAGVGRIGGQIEGASARDVRELEARAIAAQCRAILDEGWEAAHADGSPRRARFSDMAILIPARTVLAPLERSLAEAAIPYRVEGGSLIYRTQEVCDLINCLTAIDDPADEVAVVGALRSPAFACSDVDLARHRAGGGSFNYLSRELETWEGPVADGLRTLARYHSSRHERSLAALIESFTAECGQVETGILDQGDRNSFRRVRFVVEQARAFEAAGPESLRAFVNWLAKRSGEPILDNEGAGLDDDEDAVRILTIHAAKGLEFPIVFMAGLGGARRNETPTYMVDYVDGRVAVCIGARTKGLRFELGPVQELKAVEDQHAQAEFDRMLYVAATRARDHLLVSLYHSSKASRCGAWRLIDAGATRHIEALPELPAAQAAARQPFADLTVDLPAVMSVGEFTAARSGLVEASRRQRYTSATALGPLQKNETTDATEPWARGRGGTRLGRAVHAAIQSLPLDADEAMIRAFARAQAVAEAVPDRAGDVERLVRRALGSEAAARARGAVRALREVPFALQVDGVIVEGFVDLVIETAQGIEIVDWKTDQIPAQEVEERLREYELQAGLYVFGIESATGRPVRRVTYVFAAAGAEVSPGEPAALAAAARSRLFEGLV